MQWSVPDVGGSLALGTDVLSLASLASAFDIARTSGATGYSTPYERGDGVQHFLLIRPLTVAGMHDGFIVADFNIDTLFDIVHNNSLHHLPVAMASMLPVPMVTTLHTPPVPWLESEGNVPDHGAWYDI